MAGGERPWFGARLYAFLFRFLGPAQLGSQAEPPTAPADPSYTCPVCGRPMADHTWTTDAGRRRMRCPAPPRAER